MDLVKLQTDILNQRFSLGHMRKKTTYFLDTIEGKYYIAPNAHFVFIADVDSVMLDMQKVGIEDISIFKICELAEKEAKTELELNSTITISSPDTYGKKSVYLEGKDLKILVNQAYLKLITKNQPVRYYGYGELAPVVIKNLQEDVIGVMAPVKQDKG